MTRHRIVGATFAALMVLSLVACDTDRSDTDADRDAAEETSHLTGEFIRWEPVDDARGYAYFSITNHGTSAEVAECTIEVSNDFGNFGFDILVGENVPAGETISGRIPIDVSEGSFLINHGEVTDC